MKSLKKVLVAISLIALSSQAQASFLVEPHLGFNLKGSGESTSGGIKDEYDYNGTQYGLRLGGQYLGFMAGLDYTASNPEFETKSAGVTSNDKLKVSEVGLFVGYNLPILLRAWGAYYFSSKGEDDNSGGAYAAGTEFKGSTKELGVGFTGLPFVSLNLMYRNRVWDEVSGGGVTVKLNGDEEVSTHEFVVGVSLPLTL